MLRAGGAAIQVYMPPVCGTGEAGAACGGLERYFRVISPRKHSRPFLLPFLTMQDLVGQDQCCGELTDFKSKGEVTRFVWSLLVAWGIGLPDKNQDAQFNWNIR